MDEIVELDICSKDQVVEVQRCKTLMWKEQHWFKSNGFCSGWLSHVAYLFGS